jgi:hypothetical protein
MPLCAAAMARRLVPNWAQDFQDTYPVAAFPGPRQLEFGLQGGLPMAVSIYTEIYNSDSRSAVESEIHGNMDSALAWLKCRISVNPTRIGRFKSNDLGDADAALFQKLGGVVRVQ